MTLEDLAQLIRGGSDNLSRRMEALQAETCGQLRSVGSGVQDIRQDVVAVKADLSEVRRTLDLAETVAAMRKRIETLEAEVAELRRSA